MTNTPRMSLRYGISSRIFEYNTCEFPETNWDLYDYAQIKEFANYLNDLRDLVDEADKRMKKLTC
ncbi:MAG: hypothetical protein HF976_01510 [ANME-2 cluster archaeon]|nr:hypothetical protein [ANME-2 cluster archaeon]MBC2700087.1 hypothetical protein [ANME-2 cluster archaeon]MBC2707396.1 hypothetical protein [ANME-2 cluster archaeon]MBC2746382.1 hypothetical protein [ANME-2 cluster archaeon]MBC2763602.1 hypothetical protein [ANME-2 cluster archaeon]